MNRPLGRVRGFLNRTIVPRSLFWRSLLIVILPLLILQLVLTLIFYNRHWDTVTRWLAAGVAGEVAVIARTIEDEGDGPATSVLLDRFERFGELRIDMMPGIDLESGEVTGGIDRSERDRLGHIDAKILEAFSEKLDYPFVIDLRPATGHFVIHVQLPEGVLRVTTSRKRVTTTTTGLLLFWMVGASAVLIAVAVYFLRLQVTPIRDLARAVDSFGKGRDDGDFTPRGPSEIRQAARAFNTMRQRILRHISQRTQMLAAISHDLRTPLTRMRLELELLDSESDLKQGLKDDVEDMIELVGAYLAFVRGEESEASEPIDLAAMLDVMRQRAERGGVSAKVLPGAPLTLTARPLAFKRCLANLVDNAVRFARHVELAATHHGADILITIDDDGPGIPEPLLEQVFQPFFRLDQARGRETGGTGLGLTIARDIALGHGGELTLERSLKGGVRAVLKMPA